MMPLHCLWAESNIRARGQFDCDVTCFVFVLISFVHMHDSVVVVVVCLFFFSIRVFFHGH